MTAIASIALHAIHLADARVGERIALVGCGLVGQIAVRLLHAAGVDVIALDIDPTRVGRAGEAGASAAFVVDRDVDRRVRGVTQGHGVDATIVTAAATSNDPLITAAEISRDRGAIVLVGDVPIDLPRSLLYEKELSFRVSRSYGPGRYDRSYEELGLDYPIGYVRWTEKRNMEAILNLEESGRLDLSDLVEEVVSVEEAVRAYDRLSGATQERPHGALLLAYADNIEAPHREALSLDAPIPTGRAGTVARPTPVRIGLIGPGSFASRVLIPAFVRAGAQLEIVAGGSGPSAEAASRELGFSRIAPDAAAVISDEDVDAIVVATRHATHAELSIRALEAGKHVFCEKPLALTREQLEAVVALAAGGRAILAVGFNRRFAPLLRELREFLAAPTGQLAASYRVSAGRLEKGHWIYELDEGGGRILGEVCHFIDALRFLAGADIHRVHATAYGGPQVPLQARDNVAVNLAFEDGSIGTILYVADGSPSVAKERLEAFTDDRTAILDDYRALQLLGPGRTRKAGSRRRDKGHQQEVAAFLRAVAHGEPPVALAEIANVSLATLAVVESIRTARPVQLESLT